MRTKTGLRTVQSLRKGAVRAAAKPNRDVQCVNP
ncbi:hypothetical protein ABIC35_000589 [Sphingomonas trueperi]